MHKEKAYKNRKKQYAIGNRQCVSLLQCIYRLKKIEEGHWCDIENYKEWVLNIFIIDISRQQYNTILITLQKALDTRLWLRVEELIIWLLNLKRGIGTIGIRTISTGGIRYGILRATLRSKLVFTKAFTLSDYKEKSYLRLHLGKKAPHPQTGVVICHNSNENKSRLK